MDVAGGIVSSVFVGKLEVTRVRKARRVCWIFVVGEIVGAGGWVKNLEPRSIRMQLSSGAPAKMSSK